MKTIVLAASLVAFASVARAVVFSSGSDGSDGALAIDPGTSDPVTIVFDPTTHLPPLDVDGDGIYHFTTISIPANVTLKLRATECGWQPIVWLATGAVTIAGTLDLSGDPGNAFNAVFKSPSIPGPGGYPGGNGANSGIGLAATAGLGPQGGTTGQYVETMGGRHQTYGNIYLRPLTGGSGGGGSTDPNGAGGGAGGGTILIASTTSVAITGGIRADGGATGGTSHYLQLGGRGAAGSVRIVAPTIQGNGWISAMAGTGVGPEIEARGRVRFESTALTFGGSISARDFRAVTLAPSTYSVPNPDDYPTLRVVAIDGENLPAHPRGSFVVPDVVIDNDQPVEFEIEAANVPPGTVVTLILINESTGVQSVQSAPLAGTLASSSTTATATLSHGFTRGFPTASW